MFISVIVPVYKDLEALKLILDALNKQTYKNFEIVVAEDDDALETVEFLKAYKSEIKIQHYPQEDKNNRKAMILNKVMHHVLGEYIIFIDGDVIPYSTFVESHLKLSEPKTVLCGRRVNLGAKVSQELRDGTLDSYDLERRYLSFYSYLKDAKTRHYEQGLRFKPDSFFYKIVSKLNKNIHILGSNFSCFKEDIFAINGFDEDIVGGSKDDVDLEWRFVAGGCKLKSCKYSANLFHLDHSRSDRREEESRAKVMMQENQKNDKFIATNGIFKR